MTGPREINGPDLWQLEFAGENAVQRLFALTRYRFRELQESDGFSQQQLADKMGLTRSQISRSFSNPSMMTVRTAAKMLTAMGRSLEFRLSSAYSVGGTVDGGKLATSNDAGERPALRLVAAPADHTTSSEAVAGPPPPPEPLGKPVETEAGICQFMYVDGQVIFVLTKGEGGPTKLTLGTQPFTLHPIVPGSNTFQIAPQLARGDVTKAIKLHQTSPTLHPVSWA